MLTPEVLKSIESANLIKQETDDLQRKIGLAIRVLSKVKIGLDRVKALSSDLIEDEGRKPGSLFPHGIDSDILILTPLEENLKTVAKDIASANARISLWFRGAEKSKKNVTKVYRKLYDGDEGEPF